MRVVWLNGAFVTEGQAHLSIDDPAVRFGEGLFESMRAADGVVPLIDRHLARLGASITALGLTGMPAIADVRRAIVEVAAACGPGVSKIRASVTPHPTLLVEGAPTTRPARPSASAVTITGAWHPGNRLAEHKTLSFLGWRTAQRQAEAAGADTGVLLDADGHLGEAATANVFCVADGELLTAPARGLLAGTTRALVMEAMDVREALIDRPTWSEADEIILTSAITRVAAVTRLDGRPVGDGSFGPVANRIAEMLERRG